MEQSRGHLFTLLSGGIPGHLTVIHFCLHSTLPMRGEDEEAQGRMGPKNECPDPPLNCRWGEEPSQDTGANGMVWAMHTRPGGSKMPLDLRLMDPFELASE